MGFWVFTLAFREFDVGDADVILEEGDHREGYVVENLSDTLFVHYYLNYKQLFKNDCNY